MAASWKKILTSSEIASSVTNGNTTTVPSEDAVHDFVTSQGYSTTTGTVTSVTAGTGMTQTGSTNTATTLNVIGGDGITVTADEVEVTVDGITIELSASNGAGAVRAKTAAITDGGTALATADQIYDHVTTRISGLTSNTGVVETITSADTNVVTIGGTAADVTVDVVTAAIANAGTGLATADQIHTFVTTQTDAMVADTTGNAGTSSAVSTTATTTGSWKIALVTGDGSQESVKYDGGLTWNAATDELSVTNLKVAGTTTTVNSTNLEVLDQFVLLNNASTPTDADGGIVIEGSTKSVAFGYDQSADRWGFDKTGATSGMSSLVVDAYAVSVHTGSDAVSQDSDFAMNGNIYVDTANNNVYIYA